MKAYQAVRTFIERAGLKQISIARKAGIPNSTFNAIMNGKRTMYADDLIAICDALGVDVEHIVAIVRSA